MFTRDSSSSSRSTHSSLSLFPLLPSQSALVEGQGQADSSIKVYHLHSPFTPPESNGTELPGKFAPVAQILPAYNFWGKKRDPSSPLPLHQCSPAQVVPLARASIPAKARWSLWAMTQLWGVLPAWRHAPPASSRSWPMLPTRQGRMPGWCAYSSSAAGEKAARAVGCSRPFWHLHGKISVWPFGRQI